MHLLPNEQEKRIKEAVTKFETTGALNIFEPCNCGSHFRHTNGGNYHQEIYLQKGNGQVFVQYNDTCELTPATEWQVCKDWKKVIKDNADWL